MEQSEVRITKGVKAYIDQRKDGRTVITLELEEGYYFKEG
jgi:hypothetical protein